MANPLLVARQIKDGVITGVKLATGAAIANLAVGSISSVVYDVNYTTDYWTNTALGAGNNGFSGLPPTITFSGGHALVLLQASTQYAAGPIGGNVMGWNLFFQNSFYTNLSRIWINNNGYISCTAAVLIPGPLNGGLQIGPVFYTSAAHGSGFYLRCASASNAEYMRMQVLEIRR